MKKKRKLYLTETRNGVTKTLFRSSRTVFFDKPINGQYKLGICALDKCPIYGVTCDKCFFNT